MRPPFRYLGGKVRMTPWILSLLPEHRTYVEPFAGSAAVLLGKARSKVEVLNDIDGGCVAFWTALRDRPEELDRACALTPYAREEYDRARATWRDQDDLIERARRWWVATEQSCSGVPDDTSGWSISSKTGSPRSMTSIVRTRRFRAIAERIAGVYIENRPAVRVVEQFAGDDDGVIYCDPPYVVSSRSSGRSYRHEMSDDDHRELAEVLHAADVTVLLSGYFSPLYEELYGDWYSTSRSGRVTAGAMHGTNKRSLEVIWSNRPLQHQRDLFTASQDAS